MKTRWLMMICGALAAHAGVVGTSVAAPSLTVERVRATLPRAEQAPWIAYIARSSAQMAEDKRVFAAERAGMSTFPPSPAQHFSARSIPLDRAPGFYAGAEARHIGDVIVSFQTPAGGWSKNLNMGGAARVRGQAYATANLAPVATPGEDFDRAADEAWHYVGTLDNDATNTEIHFLARLSKALPGVAGAVYRAAALRGIGYVLQAQFPNGGWPQVWPLEGGYHDAITFNDDAVTESAEVLRLAAAGERGAEEDFSFVPAAVRAQAAAGAAKAVGCILRTQLMVNGQRTVWAQQNDALTLAPVAARNFEPAALSSGESASVMLYLMSLPSPTLEVQRAVDAAARWFEANEIRGYVWSGGRSTPGGRRLTALDGAGPLWARYVSLTTGQPVFGDRDRSIHDDVMEISLERRNGYAWFGDEPKKALAEYAVWKARVSSR